MGLRERVALILVTVIIVQITISQCLPIAPKKAPVNRYLENFKKAKGMKSLSAKGAQTSKSIYKNGNTGPKDAELKKSMYKAYNFPEMEYMSTAYKNPFNSEANANTYKPFASNIGKPPLKAVDDFKKQLRLKRKLHSVNDNENYHTKRETLPFSNVPHTYSEDTFPEVLYPINAMETWGPHYWPTSFKEEKQQFDVPEFPIFNAKATEICKQNTKPFKRQLKSKAQQYMEEMDKLKQKMQRPTMKNTTQVKTCDKPVENLIKPVSNSSFKPLTSQETKPVTLNPVNDIPELSEILPANNITDRNQGQLSEKIKDNATKTCNDHNSENNETTSATSGPLNINIPIPIVKDIGERHEPNNNFTVAPSDKKAHYKSIIVVPVGDSIRQIELPVIDTSTDSPIILLISTPARTDTLTKSTTNISSVTEVLSKETPVNNNSNKSDISEASQDSSSILPDLSTELPVTVKEYSCENISDSLPYFEILPNNSMCHVITDSSLPTTDDSIPIISTPDILPLIVQNVDQISLLNNSIDITSPIDSVSKNNNSQLPLETLYENETYNDFPITQSDTSNILSPLVVPDGNMNNEEPIPSDSTLMNTANEMTLLPTENIPEDINSETNTPNPSEHSLQPEENIDIRTAANMDNQNSSDNDNEDLQLSNSTNAGSNAEDTTYVSLPDVQEAILSNSTETFDNATSTPLDDLADESLPDFEGAGRDKDISLIPLTSKLEDNSDDSAVNSSLPTNIVNSDKETYVPIKDIVPINDELSDESGPNNSQDSESEIPTSESETTPSIDQADTPISDMIEPQTDEYPVIGPTEDNNTVSTPNIDDPKEIVDIFSPTNDPESDTLPIDDKKEENGEEYYDIKSNDRKLPDQPLLDDNNDAIIPVDILTPDTITDNTEDSSPDSISSLPSAVESSDPLPLEEELTDTKVIEDLVSPEVPIVSGLSDDVTIPAAESLPMSLIDKDLSSAEVTNLIKYLYTKV